MKLEKMDEYLKNFREKNPDAQLIEAGCGEDDNCSWHGCHESPVGDYLHTIKRAYTMLGGRKLTVVMDKIMFHDFALFEYNSFRVLLFTVVYNNGSNRYCLYFPQLHKADSA